MTLTRSIKLILFSAATTSAGGLAHADELAPVNVTADFYETPALELGSSVSVFSDVKIQERGAEHLEQLFNLAPNVNYAAGASRGRFIQIRGIGERSQYVDPVNSSVGVLIDGIDFTGIATAASMLDVKQVEVLRGPQGTLFGANALAGVINVVSNEAGGERNGQLGVTLGEYGTRVIKGAVGGSLSDTLGYRLAAQSNVSDGYIENTFLSRDDTNNIDESTFRGKLAWQAKDNLKLDFTAFFADVNNGYDAFSLDNNRNTLSDQPGQDKQETYAGAVRADWRVKDETSVEISVAHADSTLEYGYDEDWAYTALCQDFECLYGEDSGYSSYDNYLRDNVNTTVDVRVLHQPSGDGLKWVAGVYDREQSVDLTRIYTYQDADFRSGYDTSNAALYGQLEQPLGPKLKGIAGVRYEQYKADYSDSLGFTSSPDENLVGGKLALEFKLDESSMVYGLVARGYKPGGFNASDAVPVDRREFTSESMWNYETGYKAALWGGKAQTQVSLFYQDRKDIQAKQYFAVGGTVDQPVTTFVDFIDNAASGSNYGLEAELVMAVSDNLSVDASLGLLRTAFDEFSYFDSDGNEFDKSGRDQAHAPHYQYSLGASYLLTPNWMLHGQIEGKDAFYFSDSHDMKSKAYSLVNARISYFRDAWEFALWGRNLTDEDYALRGFDFANDPRDGYVAAGYTQLGEPRIFGVSANYTF